MLECFLTLFIIIKNICQHDKNAKHIIMLKFRFLVKLNILLNSWSFVSFPYLYVA